MGNFTIGFSFTKSYKTFFLNILEQAAQNVGTCNLLLSDKLPGKTTQNICNPFIVSTLQPHNASETCA